ncbi:MAG: hypothetical protein V5A27_07555 [Halapricum sp.]
MTNRQLGRWLLVALAIVGLAFAAPAVSAHGDEPTQGNETAADGMPTDTDAAGWAAWMEAHMGVTVDEMAKDMADDNHTARGMNGQGHGC